jgi:hypothetical protein
MVIYEKLESVNQNETKTLESFSKKVYYVDSFTNINGKIVVPTGSAKIILLPSSFIFFNKPSTLVGLGDSNILTPTLFLEGQETLGTPVPNINLNEIYAGIELNINMTFKNLNLDFYKLGGNFFNNTTSIIDVISSLRIISRYRETTTNKTLRLNSVSFNQCNEGLQTIILNNYSRKDLVTECFIENLIYNSNRINVAVYCSNLISINDQSLNTPKGLIVNNATITNGYIECLWMSAVINKLSINNEILNPLLQKSIFNFDVLGTLYISLELSIKSIIPLININVNITLNQYIYNQITNNGLYNLGTTNLIFLKNSRIKYLAIRQDSNISLSTVFSEINNTQVARANPPQPISKVDVVDVGYLATVTIGASRTETDLCKDCIKKYKRYSTSKLICRFCANDKSAAASSKVCVEQIIKESDIFGETVYNFNNCPNNPP